MSRNRPPSFDFYPDDFIAGTLAMHPTARGIYITLLCHQWSHGSIPNPTNIRQFVQITGAMPDELSEHLDGVLSKFEQLESGEFVNKRLHREYERKIEIIGKRRDSGALGGRPKANAKQKVKQNKSKTKAKQEEGSRKKEELKKENGVDPSALPLPFESAEFAAAWAEFVQMRRETKRPMKPTGMRASLKKLAAMGEARAIAALDHTTSNEWQGIREPEHTGSSRTAPKTFAQQRIENSAKAIEDFANGFF